jgi:mRNA-degrading endonuclease RelE of RelBE toxin-antitoxin system
MMLTGNNLALFTSEIAPTAWKQISRLPQDMYLALLARLRTLASLATVGRHPVPAPIRGANLETALSFLLGDFAALYEVDFQRRVIRLLEIARRLPTDPITVPTEKTDHRVSAP